VVTGEKKTIGGRASVVTRKPNKEPKKRSKLDFLKAQFFNGGITAEGIRGDPKNHEQMKDWNSTRS